MNTERKVKTVRFNSHPDHPISKMYNDGEIIKVIDTAWRQDSVYVTFINKNGIKDGAFAGFDNRSILQVMELHPEEPQESLNEEELGVCMELLGDVEDWGNSWKRFEFSVKSNTPLSPREFAELLLEKYTITKK